MVKTFPLARTRRGARVRSRHARTAGWPWLLLGALSALAAPALAGTWLNVSEAVTGTSEALPPLISKAACGSRCRSVFTATVGRDDAYTQQPASAYISNWPAVYTAGSATLKGIALQSTVPAPGSNYDGFDVQTTSVERRSSVSFNTDVYGPTFGNSLVAQTWATGSGTALMSYGARLQVPAGQARKAYLSLAVPEAWATAFVARSSPGNGTTQHYWPSRAASRLAVDVYVNGLPVWNSEQAVLFPERFSDPYGTPMRLQMGPVLEGDRIQLFLGTLPAGSVHQVAVIFRADSRALAGTCRSYVSAGDNLQSCHTQRISLSLPAMRRDDGDLMTAVEMRPDIVVEMQP